MRDQVGRLRRLAVDLRSPGAAPALHLARAVVDAGTLAAGAVVAALPGYRTKGVTLHHRPNPRWPTCRCWPTSHASRGIAANLLESALRHTPSGGDVTVRAASAGSRVTLTVSDDGDGIPIEQLRAVFDLFHRVDPSRATTDGSGSGLGLTIARAIIADHGGTLEHQ